MNSWSEPARLQNSTILADCPNCGADGAPIGAIWREWKTGRTFRYADGLETRTSSSIVAGFAIGTSIIASWLLGPDFIWWGLGLGVILALVLITILVYRNVQRSTRAYRILKFKCRRCLHQWEQEDGKPPPRYNERQEILADYRSAFNSDDPKNNAT
jgi:hypothetical protein